MQTLNSKPRLQWAMLPSEIMYHILSRMPVKSLARFRCVSKQWCNYINDPYLETMHAKRAAVNDPTLIMIHKLPSEYPNSLCTLSFLEYKEETDTCTHLEVRTDPPVMDFMCKMWSYNNVVLGSCNGLLYLSQKEFRFDVTTLIVIHPLRGECYELPQLKTPFNQDPAWGNRFSYDVKLCVEWSCGLGFDDSTNSFKMVCIVPRKQVESPWCIDPHQVNEGLCTMVHVLGTDSWRKIPQAPSYHVDGEGVFSNRRLHWLASDDPDNSRLITFDMKTEEFGLIYKPLRKGPPSMFNVHLVNLCGQVGYVYMITNHSAEVWVLKERVWVMHCEFEHKPCLSNSRIKVLGFWNRNGDILVTYGEEKRLFVYNLKGESFYEASFVGWEEEGRKDIQMYQNSLFSTRYSVKNLRNKR
ncbi:putative F-box domain, galactose oxidase/kelch, beta-propeller, F-box associated interaction [Helianthus annuus]|nr:putative F-box domain, galactose oxidase/kelch, beta-propeller, F-box associated interaction [Helianthus annuus]KAJ0851011.1 putative F-box domain, galactose oxidase/kelch, beta-propeller, F-box associated interaction [Helianthus annuus]